MLWSEATIAQQRVNAQHATSTVLMQAVVASVLGGKDAGRALQDLLKGFTDGN